MITLYNRDDAILYQTLAFREGVDVSGYIIYPDMSKTVETSFTELGDGIYFLRICLQGREGFQDKDKFGIVIKENGAVTKFETILVDN